MLLNVKDLAVTYGRNDSPTISGVTFDLKEGEILSIVGESGSGKTTVIRSILGVLPNTGFVSNGQMIFGDRDLAQFSEKDWQKIRGKDIGMIFQDCGNMMDPIQTIGKQFIEYIQLHSPMSKEEAYAKAVSMLGMMNLNNPEALMKAYPFELSGGMRQRVGIAMAITFAPQLLLADEPTSALDVTTQAQIVDELLRVARESRTAMIIVTHNIGVAAHMSDRIMVMKLGKVVEYGTVEEVIHNPKEEYTKNLLRAVPEIGGERLV